MGNKSSIPRRKRLTKRSNDLKRESTQYTNKIKIIQRDAQHASERPFVCSFGNCKKRFARSDILKEHIRRHIGDKIHKCSYCSKAFISSNELKVHVRIHTGEKPFKCLFCNKRFTQKGNEQSHHTSSSKINSLPQYLVVT